MVVNAETAPGVVGLVRPPCYSPPLPRSGAHQTEVEGVRLSRSG